MIKKVFSNLPRAGLLAIPYAGSALEKAIYGPLDDKSKEKDRQQLLSTLDDLKKNVQFVSADVKDQLKILAKNLEDTNTELAKRIEQLNPVQIEVQITQHLYPTIIHTSTGLTAEDVVSLFRQAGVSLSNLPIEERPKILAEQLLDFAIQTGKLADLISELEFRYPYSFRKIEKDSEEAGQALINELTEASRSLLTWPQTIGEKWIERKEVSLIENIISSNERSTTLLLGKPGTGKSALLSFLANNLIQKRHPVLGIKADMLPKVITDSKDLQNYLKLSFPIIDSLVRCSKDKHVVLIIDQLDALSELVDRNSDRLNILLDLIQSVANRDGIHVISSCRWFEYQHDVRLTTIDAEKIDLTPPFWQHIKEILLETGFLVDNLSEETKSLLSVPLYLKILLDIKTKDADVKIPSSLQALLENIWQQRVVAGVQSQDKIELIDRISAKMAENEELWVARVLADNYPSAFQDLQKGNILKLDDMTLRIGFVHQTYFDFARARLFAAGQEELSDFVIQRQDGLFVRPIILRTLSFLRDTSRQEYSRQLDILWKTNALRPHIRQLLIEYVCGIENPNEIEISCILPLLDDEQIKYKIISAMAGSPGWFKLIKDTKLPNLMREGSGYGHLLIPFLSRAFSFAKKDVLKLVKIYWLDDHAYDDLTLSLLTNLADWDRQSVDIASVIVQRHESHWISYLAEIASQSSPDLAANIVRADLERRWELALKKELEYQPPPPPPPGADDVEKEIYKLTHNRRKIFERDLWQDRGWHNLSVIAESAPEAFINSIWPWFVKVVKKLSYDPHPFLTGFQDDFSLELSLDRETISEDQPISALRDAITSLSRKDSDSFIKFFIENIHSPYLSIHRFLCIGLLEIIESHPNKVLEYLTSDPRHLAVGDSSDQHKYTKMLIRKVIPKLGKNEIVQLEEMAINWNRYYKDEPDWIAEDKFKRIKWNREDRLRLLRAFPTEYSSEKLVQLKIGEERALPGVSDRDSRFYGGGFVGSPMSNEQMIKAKDEHILNLFGELEDNTEWDHPRRERDFIGGSVQASREFASFAEKEYERAASIISKLEPTKQERPAGYGIEGLSRSELDSKEFFKLITSLVNKGFSGLEFRREVARGLRNRAKKDKGLPDSIIQLLKNWMGEDPHPSIKEAEDDNQDKLEESILWGYSHSFSLPGGREIYLEAIALGLLYRSVPDYDNFAMLIVNMLKFERHPKIWQFSFHWMKYLFAWDKKKNSQLYSQVLQNCPEVIEDRIGIIELAEAMRSVSDKKTIQSWLTIIGESESDFRKQAYGELLMFYYFLNFNDKKIKQKIEFVINDEKFLKIQRGIAFTTSRHWRIPNYQSFCTNVLVKLSQSRDEITQRAISGVFPYAETIPLNDNMKRLIEAILPNDGILIESAERLVEGLMSSTATEPDIVAKICKRVVEVGEDKIQNIGSRLSSVAEPIVSIALTLHRRQPPYRGIGLDLFEKLIESNITYARQALDLLDRKPMSPYSQVRPRRRIRRKRSN